MDMHDAYCQNNRLSHFLFWRIHIMKYLISLFNKLFFLLCLYEIQLFTQLLLYYLFSLLTFCSFPFLY